MKSYAGWRQERSRGQARRERTIRWRDGEQVLGGSVQVAETNLGFKNPAQIRTDYGPVRTAMENPSDEISQTRRYSPEGRVI